MTLSVLYNLFYPKLSFLSSHERKGKGVFFRGRWLTVIGDGSEQQIITFTEKNLEQVTYSGKKRKHTLTLLLFCAPTGHIYYLSKSYPGSLNDLNLYHLPENQIHKNLEPWEAIGLDGGFKGVDRHHLTILPIEEHGKGELDEDEKEFNNEFSGYRTVVENVFAHIKQWSICKQPFRGRTSIDNITQEHHMIWAVCAGFVNRYTVPIRRYYPHQ